MMEKYLKHSLVDFVVGKSLGREREIWRDLRDLAIIAP
jgi:hypothetical protein